MNSASSNYSDSNFSAKSNNFHKIIVIGGFNILWIKMSPRGLQKMFGSK